MRDSRTEDVRAGFKLRPSSRLAAVFVGLVVLVMTYGLGRWMFHPQTMRQPDRNPEGNSYVGLIPADIELGDQPWNHVLPLEFTFANDGDSPVVIQSVRSSCDCTVIERSAYEGRSIPPGDFLPFDVEFHTLTIPGRKRRRVDVVTENGQTHSVTIHVNIVGSWSLSPDFVDFGDVVLEDVEPLAEGRILFSSEVDQLLDVSAPNAPWIECRISQTVSGDHQIAIRVLRKQLPVGQGSGDVFVRTSCSTKPTGVVYVKARGVHNLTPVPSPILLVGNLARHIHFTDRDGIRVRIVSATTTTPDILATVLDNGDIELRNPSGVAFPEAVPLHVVDSRGRARVVYISVL